MTPTEFKTHLTDVTDEIITAYFHRIDTGFKITDDQTYKYIICHNLMIELVDINQLIIDDHTDLNNEMARFGLKTPKELKRYCQEIFKHQIIYELDPSMTKMIFDYFSNLKLDLQNQLSGSIAYMHEGQTRLYFIANPQYASQNDFNIDINISLFGGDIENGSSFERFLNTIN